MTDEEFLAREEQGAWMKDECYPNWTYLHGGFEDFNQTSGLNEEGNYKGEGTKNSHLLSRTINSKTIREWRLVHMVQQRDIYGELADVSEFGVLDWKRFKFNTLKWFHALRGGCHLFGGEAKYWEPYIAEIFPEKEKYKKRFSAETGLKALVSKSTYVPSPYVENVSCRSEYNELSFESGFEFLDSER